MKTAREHLFDEATGLLVKAADDGSAAVMRKIMARYRVQTKPGVDIPAGATARDALGERLVELWRAGGNDDTTHTKMGTLIDQFRMQLKQAGGDKPGPTIRPDGTPDSKPERAPPPRPRPDPVVRPAPSAIARPEVRPPTAAGPATKRPPVVAPPASKAPAAASPSVTLAMSDPPMRPVRGPEPVAGGPRTRKKARGECPKCKSMGVVLARSYSGDEYYSCVYCGWQAYRPADDADPNASLAIRLLGQTLGSD
jgi:hypothetical protein